MKEILIGFVVILSWVSVTVLIGKLLIDVFGKDDDAPVFVDYLLVGSIVEFELAALLVICFVIGSAVS